MSARTDIENFINKMLDAIDDEVGNGTPDPVERAWVRETLDAVVAEAYNEGYNHAQEGV